VLNAGKSIIPYHLAHPNDNAICCSIVGYSLTYCLQHFSLPCYTYANIYVKPLCNHENKQLRLRMSERRFNKLQLYSVHADKTMTRLKNSLTCYHPSEIDKNGAVPIPRQALVDIGQGRTILSGYSSHRIWVQIEASSRKLRGKKDLCLDNFANQVMSPTYLALFPAGFGFQ